MRGTKAEKPKFKAQIQMYFEGCRLFQNGVEPITWLLGQEKTIYTQISLFFIMHSEWMKAHSDSMNEPMDLQERSTNFAEVVRRLAFSLPWHALRTDDLRQIIRSSGSIAANLIEAREAVSQPDRLYRMKICRKEAKESKLWISLLAPRIPPSHLEQLHELQSEADQLLRIFSSIIHKYENSA